MPLALGLDLGTTSISAVALAEDGRVVARKSRRNDSAVAGLPAGHAEQDPRRIRRIALDVLGRLADELPEDPHGLGITGQMHGVVCLDANNGPLTNLITWQDRRANETMPGSDRSWLQEFLSLGPREAIDATGCRPAPGYLAVTLFLLSRRSLMPAETATAGLAADWMAAELTGTRLVTDRTNAGSTGVYDFRSDGWSSALIEASGLPPTVFPKVVESGLRIGGLTDQAAAATGLPGGLPVCSAIGDNQAAVLGSVPAGRPAIQINIGTGGQINWPVESFLRVAGMDTRYLPHGRFMLVGAGLAGGDAFAWAGRTVGNWLDAFGIQRSPDEIYRRVLELAEAIEHGNDGLTCQPLFRGTRQKPHARGSFSGITNENFTVGHVARAVLEGIAEGLYSFYAGAGEARPEHLERIIGSGNGLRKNPLLVEILSRTFGRAVWMPEHEEEAACGAALLAGVETGLWPDLEAAGSRIHLVRAGNRGRPA